MGIRRKVVSEGGTGAERPVTAAPGAQAPDAAVCDSKALDFRVSCGLPKGHVKSLDDWHSADVESATRQTTRTYEVRTSQRETVRWRPNSFEVPRSPREDP
jgi:hypothetical protein